MEHPCEAAALASVEHVSKFASKSLVARICPTAALETPARFGGGSIAAARVTVLVRDANNLVEARARTSRAPERRSDAPLIGE